ncbi:MAG TPA: hypothetical protein DIT07_11350 [Sphingobacteriaceae bacterium]|nr:hypothetical protein [Sphingobacteriaceae bacterium]
MLLKAVLPLVLILIANICASAQERNLWPVKPVNIDGVSDEWTHSLFKYNSAAKLSYSIANDRSNLYILIESADQPTNANILANSIRVSINPKGKKKATTSLTFPVIEWGDLVKSRQFRAGRDVKPALTGQNLQNEAFSNANTIKINGFPRIPNGTFSLHLMNTYGIKAAARIDDKKILTYELSIPLSQLNISPNQVKYIANQIKINGSPDPLSNSSSQYPGGGRTPGGNVGIPTGGGFPGIGVQGGLSGMGGTIRIGRGQNPSPRAISNRENDRMNSKSVRFWVKYQLAKTKL